MNWIDKLWIAYWKYQCKRGNHSFYKGKCEICGKDEMIAPEPKPTPIPTPEPVKPDPAVSADAIPLSSLKWVKENGSRASISKNMYHAIINAGKVSIKYDDLGWPDKNGCNAVLCFFVKRNDVFTGGKFDHLRSGGQSTKLMENIHGGYIPGIAPISYGEEAYLLILSYDGKQRTNIVKAVWK